MNTSRGGGRNRTNPDPSEQGPRETVGTVEHCLCGLAGFFVTAAMVALLYPTLVAVTRPLHVLSSTALVVILTTVWVVTWLGLELVWTWRDDRLTTDP